MSKITHIITGLNTGGAEMMLFKLLSCMDRKIFNPDVISLIDIGPIGEKIRALGVPVLALHMRRGLPDPLKMIKLAGWLSQSKPHIIQTWMYHADLVGGLAGKMAGHVPIVWGIRHSNLDPTANKRTTIWTARLCAWFSRWLPEEIICCSEASKQVHKALGYDSQKMVVIPNGFDLDHFRPDLEARTFVRQELGISEDSLLIGLVARFDPQKDHTNFIKAAALLLKWVPDVHFLLCGDQVTWENSLLSNLIDSVAERKYFHLLGRRQDVPRLMASLDIASSSSFGEGFPNVVGEAMACGVPCVVTDVGDSALIVHETGKIVPPRDPKALANAWLELINMGREGRSKLGEAARERIEEHFSLQKITARYEELYRSIVDRYSESKIVFDT